MLRPKTVDGIMSTFTKTVIALENLITKNDTQADSKEMAARLIKREAADLRIEVQKAEKAKAAIEKLLG